MARHRLIHLLTGLAAAGLLVIGCTSTVEGSAGPGESVADRSDQQREPTASPAETLPPDRVVYPDDMGAVPADTLVNPDEYRVESLNAYVWQSPTGNIRCELQQSPEVSLGCTALEHTVTPAAGCTAEQPVTVTIAGGKVTQGCRTDQAPEGLTLAYGDTIDLDNFSCSSAEDGMTCLAGTQSFRIARASLDIQQ